jgi:DNA-binding transcriptional MerR regulator
VSGLQGCCLDDHATIFVVEPWFKSNERAKRMRMVGELAAEFGVHTSTLRYYERRGLLVSTARVGGRRAYDTAAVRRLAFIRLGQQAGLTLNEIALMLSGSNGATWKMAAQLRLEHITAELAQLQSAKILLEQALRCPADHALEECPHSQRKVDQVLKGLSSPSSS